MGGALHTVQACPDAPFVVCMGGDKPSDNFKVLDLRESPLVRSRFGLVPLQNPLRTAEFGFATAAEAEAAKDMEDMDTEAAADNLQTMSLTPQEPKPSGGIGAKFKKKDKKKKKPTF